MSWASIEDRFFAAFEQDDPSDPLSCWSWTRPTTNGYGYIYSGKRRFYAHRWSYEFFRADIPEGLHVDHLCRNTVCVNPWHLEPVSPKENIARGVMHQRHREMRAAQTHCKWGHEFTPENTGRTHQGGRRCRACQRRDNTSPGWRTKEAVA